MARTSRLLTLLAVALAGYLVFLLTRYFFPPHVPRYRVETMFMWFLAVGLTAVAGRVGDGARQAGSRRSDSGLDGQATVCGWHAAFLATLFTVAAFVLYAGAIRVGLLSDDFVLAEWAEKREWVHAAETGFVRPVVPMVWALLSFVPLRYEVTLHAVNILLHAINAMLVVALAVRCGLRRDEAVAAGLLFLTFPALSEAIVWASGMQDVLMTTLALAAISAVLALGDRPLAILVAVGSSALALGVKETAVTIPLLSWVMAWASPSGVKRGAQRQTLLAMIAIAVLYAIYRGMSGVSSNYGSGIGRYFAKQLIVEPFATLGEPWSAAWMNAHPTITVIRAVTLLALLVAAFWFWRRSDRALRRAVAFGAWVLLAVLPVFSFFHVSATLEGSRYLYLPAVGFALLLATLIGALVRQTMPGLSSVAIIAFLIVLVIPSLTAIRSEVGRWTEAARLRDAMLDSYIDVQAAARCRSIVAEGLVDNVDGAYVLRNGFTQALAARGVPSPLDSLEGYRCRVTWTDHIVIRQEP